MAHELDEMWTLHIVSKDGSGNIDSTPDGHFFLKVGTGGIIDPVYSRHYRSGGSALNNPVKGSVTPISAGYRVVLVENLAAAPGFERQYKGTLIKTSSNLILTGIRYKPEDMAAAGKKKSPKFLGQEEGTWVATKP